MKLQDGRLLHRSPMLRSRVAPCSGDIAIRHLTDPIELETLYRFRYAIYVEEMKRRQLWADHGRKRIEDLLDREGVNITAWLSDTIVGAVRVNFGSDACLGYYEQLYDMPLVGADHPKRTSICTRLMILPGFRGSTLAVRLAGACYKLGLERGVRWTFIDCNPHLVTFFLGLGYRRYRSDVHHPEYGPVTPLRFDCEDHAHLQSVKSPLFSIYRSYADTDSSSVCRLNTSACITNELTSPARVE